MHFDIKSDRSFSGKLSADAQECYLQGVMLYQEHSTLRYRDETTLPT